MDPQTTVSIVVSAVSWGGVISLALVFRSFFIAGISRAFIQVFEESDDKTREVLVRFLVDKNMTKIEAYESLKREYGGS